MTRLTFASGTLAGSALAAALLLPHLGAERPAPLPTPQPPGCTDIGCRFMPSADAIELEQTLERRGFVCTGKARLTESVIVDLAAGARVVEFERAMRIGRQGTGWMRSYCSQP